MTTQKHKALQGTRSRRKAFAMKGQREATATPFYGATYQALRARAERELSNSRSEPLST